MNNINIGSKWVCCWGYDQTQYSVYNTVSVKGKSVIVEGLNNWSNFSESDLCEGSKVKVYTVKNERFHLLNEEQRQAIAKELNFNLRENDFLNFESMIRWHNRQQQKKAPVRTIVKVQRINGESWTYIWTLDNGEIVNSQELYKSNKQVHIVNGLKKCLVNTRWTTPTIKINESIRASLDLTYNKNKEAYTEQNLYTAYNGR